MSDSTGRETTLDPAILGLRDATQKPVDAEIERFSEIEAKAVEYGVTRADLEGAIIKHTPSMQEMYAFVVTRALMAERDAASQRDYRGCPIKDRTASENNPQHDIYATISRIGETTSVTLMKNIEKGSILYTLVRKLDHGRPQYFAEYSGKRNSAILDTEGRNPFGRKLFNPDLKNERVYVKDLQWVFSRLGGFPPGFMALPAEAPKTLVDAAK